MTGDREHPAVPTVRAAGGVLWRTAPGGTEVCLVHRPRHDDWSLPKGKLEPGEHPLVGAVREVAEETHVRGLPQVRLPPVRYTTRDGERKSVDYWSMLAGEQNDFQAGPEVDRVRWCPVPDAVGLVSYPRDGWILRRFAALPPVATVLGLVRARALATPLALLEPQRLLSAPLRRCVRTLDPLADLLGLPIEVDPELGGPPPGRDLGEQGLLVAGRLARLGYAGTGAVLCGHDGVIPHALNRLAGAAPEVAATPDGYATGPGDGWLVAFSADSFVAATRL